MSEESSKDQGVTVATALSEALKRKVLICDELKVMSVPLMDGTKSLEVVLTPDSPDEPAIAVTFTTLAKLVLDLSKEYIKTHPIDKNNKCNLDKAFGVV